MPSPECDSTYDVGFGTVLRCQRHLHGWNGFKHCAEYGGTDWYWSNEEADKKE